MKLLVICGPTATGKTEAAISLAKKFNGEIVSADSRQVYRGMDIATGKDLHAYDGVPVWMLDVVEPTQPFSVAQYYEMTVEVVREIWERKKLPIVVGGTGLYIKALVDGISTISIPPDEKLRKKYENKSASELLDILSKINLDVADSLNPSEKKNKRRLIRKIEIAQTHEFSTIYRYIGNADVMFVGLTASPNVLRKKINDRIKKWIKDGAESEVKKLMASGVSWDYQSMNAIGYRQWKPYFDGSATLDETIAMWKRDEWQYAKRQMTWFRKDKRINWFDITERNLQGKVESRVLKWYDKGVKL